MAEVDLAVIGAGLAGCSLIGRLQQLGSDLNIALIEAGRGPGGRTATRRRREQSGWLLNHGAPGFGLSESMPQETEALLAPLRSAGVLQRDERAVLSLDAESGLCPATSHEACPDGGWWHGFPCMASICSALLDGAGSVQLSRQFKTRVRWLERRQDHWLLESENRSWSLRAKHLVLSGTLLAHPRSLKMLAWDDVPLRSAVEKGVDVRLDAVLSLLHQSQAEVRWNLMVDLGLLALNGEQLPAQIWLNDAAKARWKVERLVLQPQSDGRWGLVVHGLDSGEAITPESQGRLLAQEQQRLVDLLPQLLQSLPVVSAALNQATPVGVMRWGASRPLNHPLPQELQWCPTSEVGFCGDWIEGPGFGTAEGAIRSGVNLAEQLHAAS
ncbi:NAD/FAD-dependent oxidoreductase [Synechococcus sp. KORDI-52]|uniref:NAD(P)-binding protein n=1 Tax=Synechococcus sp. KORDI-52 TaxID=585425 RepID=UPI0004E03308|nr:NAD(P)-binding protein [Synechococcus sp. KORDI-52]AII49051.1 NAD/FAD-dependent oxidoreductase [Synechococcus sp. KORDI-52]